MKIRKGILALSIIVMSSIIPSTALAASSYFYCSGVTWQDVYANNGNYFNVTAYNPSCSNARQSLYRK
ncbi:hypothetical protein G8V03_14360 [Clostridium botulinum D/C]|uniref:hypothetical protein n=1 Tax=Clostridium botulinum TaxID=1491 RepID=UPI001E3F67C4|nr:hypothetical protein [Clostridium botulinum]MCD3352142.1 hypothetical protein [Clostridium botulinum D/C]MCD3361089.1 hypothetical protein [Clostridium botulinum D/C]MCD3363678.1 hypothetical protein [Clostridium botulinum D/C]MCD3366847.1 hypothetical protein [Clostridium botulinum D/C]